MKSKINEIALPSFVERGHIDLTQRREAAGLKEPLQPLERKHIEKVLAAKIEEALTTPALIEAHEEVLKAKLRELQDHRKTLKAASKEIPAQAGASAEPSAQG